MRRILFFVLAFSLVQVASFGQAQPKHPVYPGHPGGHHPGMPGPARWASIATTEVRLNAERDVINITSARTLRAIKFEVTRNPIEMYDLNVIFQNGQQQKFVVKNVFQPGTSSRALTFAGGARRVRQIIFDYRSRGHLFNQRAYVQVFGLL